MKPQRFNRKESLPNPRWRTFGWGSFHSRPPLRWPFSYLAWSGVHCPLETVQTSDRRRGHRVSPTPHHDPLSRHQVCSWGRRSEGTEKWRLRTGRCRRPKVIMSLFCITLMGNCNFPWKDNSCRNSWSRGSGAFWRNSRSRKWPAWSVYPGIRLGRVMEARGHWQSYSCIVWCSSFNVSYHCLKLIKLN